MAAKPTEKGVLLPPLLDKKGDRSSTEAGKAVMSAAMRNVDSAAADEAQKKWSRFGACVPASHSDRVVQGTPNSWRTTSRYNLSALLPLNTPQISMKSRENALTVARDGIKFLHDTFEFNTGDEIMPFSQV